jgi:hypothetical protein
MAILVERDWRVTRVISITIAMLLAQVPVAHAEWEYTKWGMTPAQVTAASKGEASITPEPDRYKNTEDHWEIAVQGHHAFGSLKLDTAFTFDTRTGGLQCVFYNATGDDAAQLKVAMIKRYGPPAKQSSMDGAQMLNWTTPDPIELTMGQRPVAAVVTHCAP